MARKETSLCTHIGLSLIVASCLLVISSSLPLNEDARLKAEVYIGVEIFQKTINQILPEETYLNLVVSIWCIHALVV